MWMGEEAGYFSSSEQVKQEGGTSCLAFVSSCPAAVAWEQAGY